MESFSSEGILKFPDFELSVKSFGSEVDTSEDRLLEESKSSFAMPQNFSSSESSMATRPFFASSSSNDSSVTKSLFCASLMNTNVYDMIRQLRDMFQMQARTERYDATRALNACKMVKGTLCSSHENEEAHRSPRKARLPSSIATSNDPILNSLPDDYKQFVINYSMNNMDKTIVELHSMLKTTELSMETKNKDVLMVRDGGVKKKHGHGNTSRGKGQVQASQSVPKVIDNCKGKGKGKKVKPNKARTEKSMLQVP
ncbi:LOW QUALITY PROTEIN: hypothetical protein OSB04_016752 [Centaurea solstitialis]|uniref:Uncharacterized protein n=1 Tax=Centaurea solstitialis TaxID=347529 RepID=A0AA38WA34_9ASTR|nr:LOW QUALITY PROTEIN: hypothetical protein OSB04_016752 [Centaurea solstitialis]